LAIIAKPSNAVLFEVGFTEGDNISSAQTLFIEFKIEIFSSDSFKKTLSNKSRAS
jgi:hypothetical protein